MLVYVAVVLGVTCAAIGAFFCVLPEADERFDSYSASRRQDSKRAGPWMLRIGLVVAALGAAVLLLVG